LSVKLNQVLGAVAKLTKQTSAPGFLQEAVGAQSARNLRRRNSTIRKMWILPSRIFSRTDTSGRIKTLLREATSSVDYSMYSTFLTASPGSVLFSRSNLLKRKDLCFSCLRLDLIRHRRSLRPSHLFSSGLARFCRVTTSPDQGCTLLRARASSALSMPSAVSTRQRPRVRQPTRIFT
jgi:hypothetical protein